jgi:cbb3-type cytochrome oxidase subunit 3
MFYESLAVIYLTCCFYNTYLQWAMYQQMRTNSQYRKSLEEADQVVKKLLAENTELMKKLRGKQ